MNRKQLEKLVVVPTLREIPSGYSDEALTAVMQIVAHESLRGNYLKQVEGPALGLIGMEPKTHDQTWLHGDSIWKNALLIGIITQDEYDNKAHPPAERLLYDLRYNVFMCRQRLFMKRAAIPHDPIDISIYLKKFWNSIHGAADDLSYHHDLKRWN